MRITSTTSTAIKSCCVCLCVCVCVGPCCCCLVLFFRKLNLVGTKFSVGDKIPAPMSLEAAFWCWWGVLNQYTTDCNSFTMKPENTEPKINKPTGSLKAKRIIRKY